MTVPHEIHEDLLAQRGSYPLIINLGKRKRIRLGRLGKVSLPPRDVSLYRKRHGRPRSSLAASSQKNKQKEPWHIDYLLRCPEARVSQVLIRLSATWQECRLNQRIASLPGAEVIIRGFGASDCCSGCPRHLFYFFKTPRVDVLPFRPYPLPLPIKEKK